MANTPLSREIGGDIMEYYRVAGAAPSPMAAPNITRDCAAEIDALRARVERLDRQVGRLALLLADVSAAVEAHATHAPFVDTR